MKKSTPWQNIFIRDNLPIIGYHAWAGFQATGGGLLLCQVALPPPDLDLTCHAWNFSTQFVSNEYVAACLLNLKIPSSEFLALGQAIKKYHPQQEIVTLLQAGQSVEILWLRNLMVTPPGYYQQVCDRWDEFMTDTRHHAPR